MARPAFLRRSTRRSDCSTTVAVFDHCPRLLGCCQADFGFDFRALSFNVGAAANVDVAPMGVAYDTTGIERIDDSKPAVFTLDQNYPNPFNPTTNIRFQISTAQKVTLRVFNLAGAEVANLVNGFPWPGHLPQSKMD